MAVALYVSSRVPRWMRITGLVGALALGALPWAWGRLPVADMAAASEQAFTFEHEDVLGTSLRLVVVAGSRSIATAAERAVLETVERERQIFSTYDRESELSRINARPWTERRDLVVSAHLGVVLHHASSWQRRSGGAFDGYAGLLMDRWRRAAREGAPPKAEELAALRLAPDATPQFRVPRRHGKRRLTCTAPGRFDLGRIAKGFIIDQALRAARMADAGVRGALLDIGGDVGVFGASPQGRRAAWRIGVVDPSAPADNARPLAALALRGQAVASSGGYARPLTVGGERHSHILDPRSGRPADGVRGATAIAKTAESADALATLLCVLDPKKGIALVDRTPGAAALVVDADGVAHPSRRWARALGPGTPGSKAAAPVKRTHGAWPPGYGVRVAFTLVNSGARGGRRRPFKRHGVAVWVEDASGKSVRILAFWFRRSELKHAKGLRTFWQRSGSNLGVRGLATISRATRRPGAYTLDWDGRDEAGHALPRGRYRIRIDINRENGPPRGHERETVATLEIDCGSRATTARAADQPELTGVAARYGRLRG